MTRILARWATLLFAGGALLFPSSSAFALDRIRVAKAGLAIIFNITEVGRAAKIWESYGLDIQTIQMDGEGPMDKAMISGDIDIALGAGTSMAFRLKGVPNIAVAALAGPPYDFVLAINPNGPIKKVADLKGKLVGVTSAGSVTYYLVKALSQQQGWGPDGIPPQPLGATRAEFAALDRGDIAGMVTTPETAFNYAEHGQAALLVAFGDVVKTFLTHAILASNAMVANHPDQVQRFLKGWFKTVAYVKNPANRDTSLKILASVMNISATAAGKAFDIDIKGLSDDGVFDPAAVDVVRNTLPEFGVLDSVPAAKDLYTTQFVPVKF